MKLNLNPFLIAALFALSLFACAAPQTADNGELEPSVGEAESDALRTADQIPEDASEEEVSEPEVPLEPITITEGNQSSPYPYPEPESVRVTSNSDTGYPEPAADDTLEDDADLDSSMQSAETLPERAQGPQSTEVLIAMPDELNLVGTYNINSDNGPQPAVLLLHMLGRTRKDWDATGFSQTLNDAGYATLALDMRGHGESVAAVDWQLTEEDIAIAWDWLVSQPGVDSENSFVIGASIGSNIALRTAVNRPSVKATVLLSPGVNYRDVTTDDAITGMTQPILMFAMNNDGYSADSVNQLAALNPDFATGNVIDGGAHGTSMFGVYEGLEESILAFLAEQ